MLPVDADPLQLVRLMRWTGREIRCRRRAVCSGCIVRVGRGSDGGRVRKECQEMECVCCTLTLCKFNVQHSLRDSLMVGGRKDGHGVRL